MIITWPCGPTVITAVLLTALTACASAAPARADEAAGKDSLSLIPRPKQLKLTGGMMLLTPKSRVAAADRELLPLARILSDELFLLTGRRHQAVSGKGRAGDIILRIDRDLKAGEDILTVRQQKVVRTRDYAHRIRVTDAATVQGFDYRAVAEGTATLLQALQKDNGAFALPKMEVNDWPHADFTAILVDVARQYIPLDTLKQVVEACRVYKVRYLILHLTDNQGWTFPSKAFPKLGSRNRAAHGGIPPKVYDLQELKDLVAFADARGVTLVPEFETPGHSDAIRLAMPEVFDAPKEPGGGAWIAVMNIARDEMYPALDTLVGEMCEVFKSSPYFHIGCDECLFGILSGLPQTKEYLKKHNMKGIHELFVQHIQRMNKMVRKRGKMTIVWEGAALDPKTMRDEILLLTWVGNSRAAEWAQKQGFTTITVPWGLGVPWPEWNMYICNGSHLKRTDKVLGATLVMWEMSPELLISYNLPGIPGRQERTWGPDNTVDEKEFTKRTEATEALLAKLILPVAFKVDGLDKPEKGFFGGGWYFGSWNPKIFFTKLKVTMSGPEHIAGTIRYTMDESTPTAQSPAYDKPLELTRSATVKAAFFDKGGKMLGHVHQETWFYISHEKNLTTDKPVTASSSSAKEYAPENAVDGYVQLDKAWWAGPFPQWLQVDLENVHNIRRIHIFPYWDGRRYYRYTVELSVDGKEWKQVIDARKNSTPESPKGRVYKFPPVKCRYLRVNMLSNSANEGVHIVEIRAYEP